MQQPHANQPFDKLRKIKIIDRRKIWVIGIPPRFLVKRTLSEWFSRFGKIEYEGVFTPASAESAVITYEDEAAASRAIEFINSQPFANGIVCRAMHGYTGYCRTFLLSQRCPKAYCPHRHEWCSVEQVLSESAIDEFHLELRQLKQHRHQSQLQSVQNIQSVQIEAVSMAHFRAQRAHIAALQRDLAQLKTSFQLTLNELRQNSACEINTLTQQLNAKRLECSAKQTELDTLGLKSDTFKVQIDALRAQNDALESKMRIVTSQNESLTAKNAALQSELKQLNESKVTEQLSLQNSYATKTDRMRRKSETELLALTQRLCEERMQCDEMRSEVNALRSQNDALRAKNTDLQAQYSRRDSEALRFEQRLQRMAQRQTKTAFGDHRRGVGVVPWFEETKKPCVGLTK